MNGEPESSNGSGKMELIATKDFSSWDDMYKIVDYLNKSLKEYHLMFGLKKADNDQMTITIYEV